MNIFYSLLFYIIYIMASSIVRKLKHMEKLLEDTSPFNNNLFDSEKEVTLKDIYDKNLDKENHLRKWSIYFDLKDQVVSRKGKHMMFII